MKPSAKYFGLAAGP